MTQLVTLTGQAGLCLGSGQNGIEDVITAERDTPAAFGPHPTCAISPRKAEITETGRQICLPNKSVSEAG